jgi:hypothetical protein
LSFEGEQQKIEHTGSRKRFSAYISINKYKKRAEERWRI